MTVSIIRRPIAEPDTRKREGRRVPIGDENGRVEFRHTYITPAVTR